ncbi:MAG: hypothetical protein DSM106950_22320 [Stigonema ocellatum SAG 48.90 = DSM 106950]|nr:hypothetical protein [Stigonema ocellatum SAG 48.90 = DSM 106950]
MSLPQKEFCFCTLALGKKYRLLAGQLAEDLEKKFPGSFLVIYTDEPKDFSSHLNVLAYKHKQQGILLCYNDKRFVMAKALSKYSAAIFIDADTRIIDNVPDTLKWSPGITTGHCENLIEHVSKYSPERLDSLRNISLKLNISLETTNYIGESLFVVARDAGKEIEFFKLWGIIGKYLELKGIHAGEGSTIGLAAAKVGWSINSDRTGAWLAIKQVTQHLDTSLDTEQQTFWDKWKLRLSYQYRLNRAKLEALKDFEFFYS